MKQLIVIGAGGFGREVIGWAQDQNRSIPLWEIKGFLDDNPKALEGFECDYPIIGDTFSYMPAVDDVFISGIGNPKEKLLLCNRLSQRGAQFTTLIHPTATIGPACSLGIGCILCPGTVITANVRLGNHVVLNAQATVGHDAIIGDGCTLSGHADVTGFVTLGKGVFLGSHAVVLPKGRVGDFAVVGAGSVVLRKVKEGATVMGVPAIQISGFQSSDGE